MRRWSSPARWRTHRGAMAGLPSARVARRGRAGGRLWVGAGRAAGSRGAVCAPPSAQRPCRAPGRGICALRVSGEPPGMRTGRHATAPAVRRGRGPGAPRSARLGAIGGNAQVGHIIYPGEMPYRTAGSHRLRGASAMAVRRTRPRAPARVGSALFDCFVDFYSASYGHLIFRIRFQAAKQCDASSRQNNESPVQGHLTDHRGSEKHSGNNCVTRRLRLDPARTK